MKHEGEPQALRLRLGARLPLQDRRLRYFPVRDQHGYVSRGRGCARAGQFSMEESGFPIKNPDFLSKNPGFLLKNVDFIIKKTGAGC